MKFCIILSFIIFYSCSSFCQNIDTQKVLFNAKLLAISNYYNQGIHSKNLSDFIHKTNAFVVKSEGFRNLEFIKVELRTPSALRFELYTQSVNDTTTINLDDSRLEDSIQKAFLRNKFGIVDSSPNNYVEQYIHSTISIAKYDIYIAYTIDNSKYCIVNKDFSNQFCTLLYKYDVRNYLDYPLNKIAHKRQHKFKKGKIPKRIAKKLSIDKESLADILHGSYLYKKEYSY